MSKHLPLPLLVATHNLGKAMEIGEIARELGLRLDLRTLCDFADVHLPPEGGQSYAENARAKAQAAARCTGLLALADDSGLEIEALGGEPGVRSSRFGGADMPYRERCARLLARLEGLPPARRRARFVCAVALAHPDGGLWEAQAVCEGRIAEQPAGGGGFGYDPIFIPEGEPRTLAQLSPAHKNAISHRGRALRALARMHWA